MFARKITAALLMLGLLTGPVASLQAADKVVIGLKWLHQFQFAGYYAALEQGYFADEGLDVELRERDTSRNIIAQVLDNELDYGVSDSILLLHRARGEPVVIVAPIMQHSPNAIMVRADAGIDSPSQLVGRRLAFYDNDSDGINILALLAEQGVLEKGLVRKGWEERFEDFRNGSVDAVVVYTTNEPFTFREQGIEVKLIEPRHYGVDLYGDMLFTSETEAQLHPERVEAVRRAVLRGWHYALANQAEMIELIYQRYNTQQKSRVALQHEARALEMLITPHMIEIGHIDPGRVQHSIDLLSRHDLLRGSPGTLPGLLFQSTDSVELNLSAEEQAFLRQLGPVRFAVEAVGWPPYEMLDDEGRFQGIAADYLNLIAQLLDIEFEMNTSLSWQDILDAARNQQLDLLPVAAATPERRQYLQFSRPYVRSPMVIVTRDDIDYIATMNQLDGKLVGVVGGYASDELLGQHHSAIELVRYDSTLQGLRALASGDNDAFVCNLAAVSYLIRAHGLGNLKISGQTPYSFDLAVAVRDDWPLLTSAIDKALASLSAEQHDAIYNRWVQLAISQPFPWQKVLPYVLLALMLVLLLGSYSLRLRLLNQRLSQLNSKLSETEKALTDRNQQLKVLSVTDKLTGIFNRHHLDSVLLEQYARSRRYARPLSVVLFDLDKFKQINDHFGHQAGDEVLQQFVGVVQQHVREADVFGRWGGEEFLLICPETSVSQAIVVAEKVRQAIEKSLVYGGSRITVSAGVAGLQNEQSLDQLISAADRHLYQAKSAGRNRVCSQDG